MFKSSTPVAKTDLTDQAKFLSGQNGDPNTSQFGPSNPLPPTPLGYEQSRQSQYRPGINLTPPQSDKRVNPAVLRTVSKNYDLLARCLSKRKEELRSLHWSIQPKERKNKKIMYEVQERNKDAIRELEDFFQHPEAFMKKDSDKWIRYPLADYQHWLNAILDDLFVIDSIAVLPRYKLDGTILSLERIASDTIKVLLDDSGRIPAPPQDAFQQWLYGRPSWNYRVDELIWRTYNPTNDSPYGVSVVEQILSHITLAMRQEAFTISYFNDTAIPSVLFKAPSDYTVTQIEELSSYLNAHLSGNPSALHEFNFIPDGSEPYQLKPFDWSPDLAKWIAGLTCAMAGISPSEMNIEVHSSGLGGKSFGEIASDVHAKQVTYVSTFLQNLFTDIIHYHVGNDELTFVFDHMIEREEEERANINEILIRTGQKSLDDIFIEDGKEPLGITNFYQANDRLYGLPDLLTLSKRGSTALNLGLVGGNKLPDGSVTEDIEMPDASAGVKTDNPNQSKDPSARIDASHTNAPDDNKSQPPKPPKQPPGTSYPTAQTVNTAKSTIADATKDASDDKDRETHELELIFLAQFYRIFRRAQYTSSMLSPNMVLSAFVLTPPQQQALADALYTYKRDVYIESYNTYARQQGLTPITAIDTHTETLLRAAVANSVSGIVNTYQGDLHSAFEQLLANGITNPNDVLDKLNSWLRERNKWKGEQVVTSELSTPWNSAVFDIDAALHIEDTRDYIVSPDSCVCAVCQSMVDNNPYTYDEARSLNVPAHPHCVHLIVSVPRGGES